MKIARAVIRIPNLDLNTDASDIGFVFKSDDATDFSTAGLIFTALDNFINATPSTGSNPLNHYLAKSVDTGSGHGSITIYDITTHLDGSPHGAPVAMETFGIANHGTDSSPASVAAVVSFRATYGTDVEFGTGTRPRARDRNRIYLGPLAHGSVISQDPTTFQAEFNPVFMTDCLAAMFDLSSSHGSGSAAWVLQVWSRKNAAVKLPIEAWMDSAPDTQRRRQDPSPGTRTFRALASV